jgi:hypothetical protein
MSSRRSSSRRIPAPPLVAELVQSIGPTNGILPAAQIRPMNMLQVPCTVSQAQILFLQHETKQQYDPLGSCIICGLVNGRHPMSLPSDPPQLLAAVFPSRERISQGFSSQSEYQRNKAVRELSEHSQVKGTFDPKKQLPKVFLQEYESKMSILAGPDQTIWIRLLPSALHSSINGEFSWVNANISLVPDITWNEAKRLFSEHWRTRNTHLLLRSFYDNLKQGSHQSVNEFVNEFLKMMQLNDMKEDQRTCDDFLIKLRPEIRNQVLLQVRLREQDNPAPLTLQMIQETARLVDPLYETLDHTPPPYPNQEQLTSDSGKRSREERSFTPSSENKVPRCENHPNSTTHSTSQCRFKRQKSYEEMGPRKEGQSPSTKSTPQSDSKNTKLTPQDQAWICVKCKQKAPGHYPEYCPDK